MKKENGDIHRIEENHKHKKSFGYPYKEVSMKYKKTTDELSILLLKSILDHDILRSGRTLDKIIMDTRQRILTEHLNHHSIWQSQANGRWCTKLGADKHLIVRKERENLENAIIEFYITEHQLNMTVQEVFEDWVEYESNRTEHSMKTINEYEYDFNRFIRDTSFSGLIMQDITERNVVIYVRNLVYGEEKIPLKRFKTVKTILRTIFNHARLNLDIECIPIKHILDDLKFPSSAFKEIIKSDAEQVFKHSEIIQLKDNLKHSDNLLELGVLLALETGVRVGELCTLRRDCFSGDHLRIELSEHRAKYNGVYKYSVGAPKKNKCRNVILNADARALCLKILSMHDSDWFFPNTEDSITEWTRSYHFDKTIRKICRRLNIPERSMHKLRKTYASLLLAHGIDEKIVQAQMGHADISTTHRAYHFDVYDEQEEVNILSTFRIG